MRRFTISTSVFLLLGILLAGSFQARGATRIAIVSGNWSSPATWGGNPSPTLNDDVIIKKSATVTVDIGTAACKSIQLGDNLGNGALSFNSGAKCKVSGNITMGSTANKTGSIDMSHGGTLQIGGSWVVIKLGTFTAGIGTVEYNGTGNQTVLSGVQLASPYNNLIISTGGIKTLSGDVIVAGALTINAGSLVIPPAVALTVKGSTALNSAECLVMQSNASGTGSFIDNGTLTGTGTARVERYLTTGKWHYISSPMNDDNASVFMNDYLKTSDPTSSTGWGDLITQPEALLQVMRGYACMKPTTNPGLSEIFKGNLNTGNESFTGNRTATDPFAGWHLIGNPYPSAIDLNSAGIDWGQFEPTAYIWDPSFADSILSYTGGNYLAFPVNGFATHSKYVPATQGFYVHIKDNFEGDATLTFKNQARVNNKVKFLKDSPVLENGLMITARGSNNYYSDVLTVHFDPSSTGGYDPGQDAYKLDGVEEAPQLYTKSGDAKLTCNALPFSQKEMIVPMGFYCGLPGQYVLEADSLGSFETTISVTLEDLKLNFSQDLRLNPSYTFTYQTSDNSDRFLLHFYKSNFGTGDKNEGNVIQVYSFQDAIYIKMNPAGIQGDLFIYDLLGREQFHSSLSGSIPDRFSPGLPSGIYLVTVVTQSSTINQKVIIRN